MVYPWLSVYILLPPCSLGSKSNIPTFLEGTLASLYVSFGDSGALIGSAEGKRKGVPTIGDNVIQSANSIIIGGVTIGDYSMIAPGALVNFDVPPHSIVIGNPGKVIPSNRPSDKYNVYTI